MCLTVECDTVVMLLTFRLITIIIPPPVHSFISGLKPSFSANPTHRTFLVFFRTDSTDSTDCLPTLLLSISVFLLFSFFSVFHFVVVGFMR